ncbi:MAG: dephospho-CoA kinase [Deinococcota bacterium]
MNKSGIQQPQSKLVQRWGLTGNIGSGKSSVARLLKAKGAAIIDADALAKTATQDPEVLKEIASQLGEQLVTEGGLDRVATAALVFEDSSARETLNGIIHPWVGRERRRLEKDLLTQPNSPQLILHDIPLLYETGLENDVDGVIVVTAPLATRIDRVIARSQLSAQDIEARDYSQLDLAEKAAKADVVIDNSGSWEMLEQQVNQFWERVVQP